MMIQPTGQFMQWKDTVTSVIWTVKNKELLSDYSCVYSSTKENV